MVRGMSGEGCPEGVEEVTEIDVEVIIPLEDLIDEGIDPNDKKAVDEYAATRGWEALSSSKFDYSQSAPTFNAIVQEGGVFRVTIEYNNGFQRSMVKLADGTWKES